MSESFPKTTLPNPLASEGVKQTKKWKEDSLDAVINECVYTANRKSSKEMNELYDIVDGIVTRDSLRKAINPLNVENYDDEDWLFEGDKNYSILNGVVKTLIGEELKRPFEARAMVINPDAVTRKEREIKEKIDARLKEMLEQDLTEDQLESDLRRLKQWMLHDAQDASERMVNQIINYLNSELDLKTIFKDGFKDKVITDSQVYYVGDNGGEPHIKKCDPRYVYAIGMGEDHDIGQADKILEIMWMSVGEVVQRYGRFLSKKHLEELIGVEEQRTKKESNYVEPPRVFLTNEDEFEHIHGGNYDYKGNVKVYRGVWKSYTYVLEVEYPDEDGNMQHKFRHKDYNIKTDLGEVLVEKIPIPEYWEGVRIGDNMYPYIKPREIQMRSIDNPAVCRSPYAGRFGRNSVVDDLLPWAIDYIVYSKKLKELWVSNIGKVARIDVSRIPRGENWDLQKWLKWARKYRFLLEDSFQMDAKGNVAGHMQQNSGYLDLGIGNEIQQVVAHLEYIEQIIERRSGVSRQRQGEVMASDGLGTTQQAIIQSVNQTEELFYEHEEVKKEVFELLVATTQYLWSEKSVKKQYVLDDLTIATLDVIGPELAQDQFGIAVTDGSKGAQLQQVFINLAHAAMQAQTIDMSDIAAVYLAPTPSSMINILKAAEQEKAQRMQEQQQAQIQAQQQQSQAEQEFELIKQKNELDFKREELQMKMQIESLKLQQRDLERSSGLFAQGNNQDSIIDLQKQELVNTQRKYETDAKVKIEKDKLNLEKDKVKVQQSENNKDRTLQRSIANKRKVSQ